MYLHNAVPVVPSGHAEEQEKGHAKVLERGVSPKALTGMQIITYYNSNSMNYKYVYILCRNEVHTVLKRFIKT